MKPVFRFAALLLLIVAVLAEMDMSGPKEFHPKDAEFKSFHWIFTLAVLFMMPSIASVYAFAQVEHVASIIHLICFLYSAYESLFLDFPDNVDNHENRTSKGTSWFLTWELGATLFVGTAVNGSNVLLNRWFKEKSESYASLRFLRRLYKILSVTSALTGWVRVCLAPVALFGFCYGASTGQCIAHGIMGSAFIFYGFILAWVLVIPWIRKHTLTPGASAKSQEFWDSSLMCLWGIVNTFTEHRWGKEGWSHGDYQHTAMGIIWWCGGLLGMWLSRKNGQRSLVPAILLIFTGYAMSQHAQHLELSTKVHAMFGLVLMAGGASRIIEISFLLKDKGCSLSGQILTFQHLPPLSLVMSGLLFMSANEEQLHLVHDLGADHSSYIMVVCGAGFMIYLWMLILLALYLHLVGYDNDGELTRHGYGNLASTEAAEFELSEMSGDEQEERR